MKRFYVIGVALVAVLAFSALAAASASATFLLAEWLLNGVAIPAGQTDTVEIAGELLLEDKEGVAIIGHAMVLCSGIFVGTVTSESLDTVTEVLSLEKTAPPILCPVQEGCESSTATADVSPVGLPWETEAELFEQAGTTVFVDLIRKGTEKVGWKLENCLVFGLPQTDECTTTTEGISELSLEGTTLIGSFSPALNALTATKLAKCSASSAAESGVVEGSGAFMVGGGGELTASSETAVS